MLNMASLLEAVKSNQEIPSNYRLAKVLDIPITTVSRWNTGRNLPSDEMAARLAQMAGLDAGQVVASIRAEREGAGPMRDLWASVAMRLAQTSAAAALAVVAVVGAPDARVGMPSSESPSTAGLGVMSNHD